MLKKIAMSMLLAGIAASSATFAVEQQPESIDAEQMQAAIASFGVARAVSEKAAAAAIEEIAQKKRSTDTRANGTVSQIPDDLLEMSPY